MATPAENLRRIQRMYPGYGPADELDGCEECGGLTRHAADCPNRLSGVSQ